MLRTLILGALLSLSAGDMLSAQETLNVPDDYDTIQEAIDEAEDGDTVLVASGTYVENVDFLGKAITLVSEDGAEDTTIDGGTPDDDLYGSCVVFESGEGQDSILDGFTLTGGTGTGDFARGGGIHCFESTPTIRNCVVVENSAAEGGGIYLGDAEDGDPVLIEDCVIDANEVAGSYAGVHMVDVNCELRRTIISGNDAVFAGGGINCSYSTVLIEDCEITANDSGFLGGGVNSIGSELTIRGCRIEANEGGSGGGIAIDGGNTTIERCLVIFNDASTTGGGIITSSNTEEMTITHCTIAQNIADDGAGFFVADTFEVPVTFLNCIVYDNDGGNIVGNDDTTVTYSLVEGDYDGTGNIDDDPEFVDPDQGDYRLASESPCIDAGDPDSEQDPDETTADMGAFFHDQRERFLRGDCDGNGSVAGLLDALYLLQYAFTGGDAPPCLAAADVDGNGSVFALTDALFLLEFWFLAGDEPPAPGVDECGSDPDPVLDCETTPDCQ